jgi:hypothetical protein
MGDALLTGAQRGEAGGGGGVTRPRAPHGG